MVDEIKNYLLTEPCKGNHIQYGISSLLKFCMHLVGQLEADKYRQEYLGHLFQRPAQQPEEMKY